jgi:transcription elongation factor GreB
LILIGYISRSTLKVVSRGFVKEDDQEDVPLVPQRAFLPDGVPNFVTPSGMKMLLAEKQMLIKERDNQGGSNENEKRIAVNFINAKLQLLESRIADARIIDPAGQPPDEVRFGATVTLNIVATARIQVFQIVGVDEADISKGKISFLSPLAKALINNKTGEKISLRRDKGEAVFKIVKIAYL